MLNTTNKKGFTVVELLIALAISSILLAAVAFAFQSSIMNYSENEDIFKTINSSRQALCRITSQLRTAEAVDPCTPSNQCIFLTPDGQTLTYDYRSADNKLYLVSGGSDYLLCDNVTAMTFTNDTFIDAASLLNVRSVQISMTVQNGNIENTISAASVIRRNLN
ncbi:MAG: prepilin-type N-terminal cleavage/methylation domain-containing protein [Sedimentisphaerales bacterium]|nr:prepilin-type N-terminal cleavage/methylation domain-containing protein [Sedimentisphaerales bacterium]